jgi:hypothetical protein
MSIDLERDLRTYVSYLDSVATQESEVEADVLVDTRSLSSPPTTGKRRMWVAVAAVVVTVLLIGVIPFLVGNEGTPPADTVVPTSLVESTPTTLAESTPTTLGEFVLIPGTWSRIPHEADVFGEARMLSVVVGGPGLVAVGWTGSSPSEGHVDGGAAVWTSVDGITWVPSPDDRDVFADGQMASVTVGGPGLVAVGGVERDDGFEAAIWTSPDGITWTRVPHDVAVLGEASMQDVTVGGPGLVAIGDVESGAAVWTSVDGTTWARVPHDPAVFGADSDLSMSAVTAGGPGLVAVGLDWSGGATADAVIWTSVDGIVWDRVPHDEDLFGGVGNQAAVSVAATDTRVIAVGVERSSDIDAAVWTSEDGIVWQRVAHDEAALGEGEMWNVTVGGPGFVSVGWIGWVATQNSDAAVWTSIDGVTWHRVPHDEDLFGGVEMWSVAAGGPGLVAVGSDGPDAAVWTSLLDD